jgi:hypothetical protein
MNRANASGNQTLHEIEKANLKLSITSNTRHVEPERIKAFPQ